MEEADDGALLVERREIIDDWRRIRNEWIVIREGRATMFRFQHTLYSARELDDRLVSAGFDTVDVYGDLSGGPYGPGADRLIVVARKRS